MNEKKAAVAKTATTETSVSEALTPDASTGEASANANGASVPTSGMTTAAAKLVDTMVATSGGTQQLHFLDPKSLKRDPAQPRKVFLEADLEEITASIRQQGVLQPPICRRLQDGSVMIVAGERRVQASIRAGLELIPVIFTDGDPMTIALVENMQRVDLSALELAEGLRDLKKHLGCTARQLAKVIGKAESTVSEALKINGLPESVKQVIREDAIALGVEYPRQKLMLIVGNGNRSEDDMLDSFKTLREARVPEGHTDKGGKKSSTPLEDLLKNKIAGIITTLNKIEDLRDIDEPARTKLNNDLDRLIKLISEKRGEAA